MFIDGAHIHIVERRHHLLSEPDVFVFVAHLHAGVSLAGSCYKSEVFRGRGADQAGGGVGGGLF